MKRKAPATYKEAYVLIRLSMWSAVSPMATPKNSRVFTKAIKQIAVLDLNPFFINIDKSPICEGISWNHTARNVDKASSFETENVTPSDNPSST